MMTSIFAIAKTIFLFSFRSYWFQIALTILFCCVVGIPLIVVGDGTAYGQLQISMAYTLGFLKTFLACSAICLSCYFMAEDIQNWNIHLLITKPTKSYTIWIGKWLGILGIHFLLLVFASSLIYCLIFWRLRTSEFSAVELRKLDSETLVGRRIYNPQKIDIGQTIQDEINRRTRKGTIPTSINQQEFIREIARQVRLAESEIELQEKKEWNFQNILLGNPQRPAHLRYRIFIENAKNRTQRETIGTWWIFNSSDGKYYPYPQKIISGIFNEIQLSPEAFSGSGTVKIKYENRDPFSDSVFFQQDDGPYVLVKICGFFQNYVRAILLIFLQLVFLITLGCTTGSILSLPMAIFISVSYIILGILVVLLQFTFPEHENMKNSNFFFQITGHVRMITAYVTFPISEFKGTHLLLKGELIERKKILSVFFQLIIFRALPIALVGIWQISKREFGLVERK